MSSVIIRLRVRRFVSKGKKLLRTLRAWARSEWLGSHPVERYQGEFPARARAFRHFLRKCGVKNGPHARICQDIRAWCAEHRDAEYRVITPPVLVTRQPPRTLEPEIDRTFEPLYRYEAPARTLVSIAGARIVGTNGLVVLPDGVFVGELVALTAPGRKAMLEGQPAYRASLPRKVTRKPGTYYPLFSIGWKNYYHWNHDLIMRASRVMDHLPLDTRFVVPASLKPFHRETLKLLGILESRLEHFDGEGVWEFERLLFSTPILKTQIDTPEPLEWFKAATLAHYQIPPPRQEKRFYLSRRLDGHYRTVNDREVEACLSTFGFETVLPGTLSLRDQAALFSQAEIIVGTGTGLFNMVFAPKGSRILQFQEPNLIIHSLWTMAEALGHRYWYLMGEAVPNRPGLRADIFVPLEKLERSLNVILSDSAREPNAPS